MKNFIPDKLKNCIKTCAITKPLYQARLKLIKEKRLEEKRTKIQANGVKTINFIQNELEKSNLQFYFDMGTLLGIVREGRLLKHDLDIDVAVYVKSDEDKLMVRQMLIDAGCKHKLKHYILRTGEVFIDSFELNGIKFDISYYRNEGDVDISYLAYREGELEDKNYRKMVVLRCDAIKETTKGKLIDEEVNIPKNAEEYLATRYGENWRIPDKNWIYWLGPSAEKIDDIAVREILDNN